MANTPPVPGKINPNAINSTVPPVPGMINPNAINSTAPVNNNQNITAGSIGADIFSGSTNTANITKPVDNNQNITAGSIGADIFSGSTNTANITKPVDNNQNIATPVNDTPTNTPNSTGSITIGGKLKDQLKGVPDTTPKTITNPTPTSTNINIKDTTKTPTPPTTIDPKIDPQGAINQWKTNGSNINQLETLVENKYGTTATLNGDTLTADINGKTYNWKVDGAGNAIKTLVGDTQNMANNQSISTSDGVFGVLSQGGTVPTDVQNTDAYKQGKLRFDNYSKFTGYTDLQLSTSLRNGDLIPGTNTYNDLQKNPVMTERLKRVSSFNATFSDNNLNHNKVLDKTNKDVLNNTSITIGNKTSSLGGAVTDGTLTANEVNTLTYNPETIAQGKKARDLKTAYQKKKSEYDKIYNDAKKELYGTGATTSMLNKMVANRRRDILPELQQASYEANNALGYYTQLKSNDIRSFSTSLNFYNQQQNRKIQRDRLSLQQNQFTQGQYYNMAKLKQSADIANAGFDIKKQNANTAALNAQTNISKLNSKTTIGGYDDFGNPLIKKYNSSTQRYEFMDSNGRAYYGNVNPVSNTGVSNTGGVNITAGTSGNIPDTNNNPFNVKRGSLDKYSKELKGLGVDISRYTKVDNQGHLIFNNPQDGLFVNSKMIEAITTRYPNVTIGQMGWAADKTWNKKVAGFAGVPMNTKVTDINPQILHKAIAKQEGFTGQLNNNTNQSQVYSQQIKDWGQSIINGDSKLTDLGTKAIGAKTKIISYMRDTFFKGQHSGITKAYQTMDLIDTILKNPNFGSSGGSPVSLTGRIGKWNIPGTPAAGEAGKFEQLIGQNFMGAINSFRGLGSLSDAEGKKVSISTANLDSSIPDIDRRANLILLKKQLQDTIKSTQLSLGTIYGKPVQYGKNGFLQGSNTIKSSNGTTYFY